MAAGIRSLAKDTAIYGASSIIGRFLNWCLVPLYTAKFVAAEYGVVNYLYSFVALALILLTYGMETGFFRYANKGDERDAMRVYSTTLVSLAFTSVVFVAVVFLLLQPIADILQVPAHPEYIAMLAITVAIDAFTSIPFAYLRYKKRPVRFATIRLVNIGINIGLNLFFILLCPMLMDAYPETVGHFYNPEIGIGYIFISNLVASVITLFMLAPQLVGFDYKFDTALLRSMLSYSFPLLILGLAGIMNQTIDKLLLPVIITDSHSALTALGIYGANYKIAVVMVMFIQAFRFAYEPFIFSQNRDSANKTDAYVAAMKYFIIFSMVIFVGVMYYLPILRHFIASSYFEGLKVVPVVMLAEFFFGVFFNLSLWYKLTDRTMWGMYFSIFGLLVATALNFLLVPRIGYMGCAWGAFGSYFLMMAASWYFGRKYFPIKYDYRNAARNVLLAMAFFALGSALPIENMPLLLGVRTLLFVAYVAIIIKKESIPLPFAGKR